jgi:hypothetical protein
VIEWAEIACGEPIWDESGKWLGFRIESLKREKCGGEFIEDLSCGAYSSPSVSDAHPLHLPRASEKKLHEVNNPWRLAGDNFSLWYLSEIEILEQIKGAAQHLDWYVFDQFSSRLILGVCVEGELKLIFFVSQLCFVSSDASHKAQHKYLSLKEISLEKLRGPENQTERARFVKGVSLY